MNAHRRAVIVSWLVLVAAAVPFSLRQSDHLTLGGYAIPGSQSATVQRTLTDVFPQVSRASLGVLLWPRRGASAAALEAAIKRVHLALAGISGVTLSNHDEQLALFAAGLHEPLVLPLRVEVGEERAQEIAVTLRDRLRLGGPAAGRIEIHLLGESALWAGLQETSKRELESAETIGFPVLLVVLLAIFGSLAAALLPIALGAVAVIVTGALIYFLSLAMQLSVFVTDTVSMLGIGVAVDYSLIILARVRQELAAGVELEQASATALATSGRAVAFSGLTVMVSLAGLWVIPVGALRSMALGAIVVVAVSVMASVSLLPALIGLLGARRVNRGMPAPLRRIANRCGRHGAGSILRASGGTPRMSWERWTQLVTRHPIGSILAAGSILLALCIPVLSMHTSTGALEQLTGGNETRVGFSEAAKLGGPSSLEPIDVLAHASSSASKAQLGSEITRLRAIAKGLPHVHALGKTHFSRAGSDATFTLTPTVDSESAAAAALVKRLRVALAGAATSNAVSVAVGGTTAGLLDEERTIATSMWKLVVAVLALAFVVLLVLLRSLLLPLKAIAMNLLSVGAAYGVLVVVFQWGWFDALFHYQSPGHVDTLIPPLILPIVFGLSMDYEVFLLTRIREHWLASGDSRGAVARGLAASARTISSAAFLLVCVFAVFVGTGLPSVKELGVGAAVAIALDATLIRLILVPATMELLGDWNWWLPRPLERLLERGSRAAQVPTSTTLSSGSARL